MKRDDATRAREADRVLDALFRQVRAEGVTDAAEIERRIFDAYPFGMRQYHPYKVWLQRVKEWRKIQRKLGAWQA